MDSTTPTVEMEPFLRRAWPVLILAGVYLTMVVVVPPKGEFPLNDDWAYASIVKDLLETGRLHLYGWVVQSLVFQVFWGTLFCLVNGFSFIALRISTLVMSFIGSTTTYYIFRECRFPRMVGLLAALTLAVNPLYVSLSYTFMTDVPALTMMLLASLFYMKGLRQESNSWLLCGSLCALSAVLIRETSLVVPCAFALWVVFERRGIVRPLGKIVFVVAIPVLGTIAYLLWFHYIHGVPPAYSTRKFASLGDMLQQMPRRGFYFLEYLGLFLLPFWGGLVPALMKALRNKIAIRIGMLWGVLLFGTFIVKLTTAGPHLRHMPYLGNVLTDSGLGVLTLRDAYLEMGRGRFALPQSVSVALTGLSTLGAALVGTVVTLYLLERSVEQLRLLRAKLRTREDVLGAALPIAFVTGGLFLLFTFLTMDYVFDRYLIVLIPPAVMIFLLGIHPMKISRIASSTLLSVFMVFSWMGVADYFAWNEARWRAARFAVQELGCPSDQIDGGFEWDGWMNFEKSRGKSEAIRPPGISWWWVHDRKYVVTFRSLPGYKIIKRFEYRTPFCAQPKYLVLTEKPST